MRILAITALGTSILLGLCGAAYGQGGQQGSAATQAVSLAPPDKAVFFRNADLQAIWKDLEARQVINKRALDGGTYSINVRIVREGDAPLVHAHSIDVWIVTAGTATAITGGELLDPQKRPQIDDTAGSAIRGGVEQPLQTGDVLCVPTGVPHGFKNVKGFRALLIRTDVK
jgi:mannose-6-phosphate isomerase-like protein (cupin superfamily)